MLGGRRSTVIAVAAISGLLAIGCGSSNAGGGGGGGATRATYVGAEVCRGCHAELFEHWEGTGHAEALASLQAIGQGGNTRCLGCHTTGMGQPGGFTSATETANLVDVQCESCHGPAGEHVGNPEGVDLPVAIDSAVCGSCHVGAHHPQFTEYEQSVHSVSKRHGESSCLPCHTAEGYVDRLNGPGPVEEPADRQVDGEGEAATTDTECWACHNPHQRRDDAPSQLRKPAAELCRDCHTFRDERGVPGTRVHKPQGEVLNATGAYDWNGTTYVPLSLPAGSSTHATATGGDCAVCHVYQVPNSTITEASPLVTGHLFLPNLNACDDAGCHTDLAAARRQEGEAPVVIEDGNIAEGASQAVIDYVNATKAATVTRLRAIKSKLDKVNLTALTVPQKTQYDIAKWNYDVAFNDDSDGCHNLDYVNLMLDVADRLVTPLPRRP
ncbi:MAG: hypothetical protein IT204_14670 [Fimbriimonadaceae bacterium]|nr:hypothetical protein [Fimbriimonadaceae bacterium]